MATIFAQLSQSDRSRYRLEVSTRRLAKRGLAPSQLATVHQIKPPQCMGLPACSDCGSLFHAKGSVACGYDIVGLDAVRAKLGIPEEKAPLDGHDQQFCIEQWNGSYWVLSLPAQYADRARDLQDVAEDFALNSPGVRFRIRRVSGTRAVLRIAARKVKGTGSPGNPERLETYSWST